MKLIRLHNRTTERISQHFFYVLIGHIIGFFALFYLVGYDIPYLFNPDLNAPLFTGTIITLMMVLLGNAIGFCLWGIVRSIRLQGKGEQRDNNIPVRKISYVVAVGTFAILILAFLFGSSSEMLINGSPYTDRLWLKAADMFITTGLLLLFVAVIAVLFGATRYYRKK